MHRVEWSTATDNSRQTPHPPPPGRWAIDVTSQQRDNTHAGESLRNRLVLLQLFSSILVHKVHTVDQISLREVHSISEHNTTSSEMRWTFNGETSQTTDGGQGDDGAEEEG